MSYRKYASVILDVSLNKTLDYGIPESIITDVRPGIRVSVPVRGHLRNGYIYKIKDEAEVSKVLPIKKILTDVEIITEDLFELGLWMARYYGTPLHQIFKTMIPATIRKQTKHKEQFYVMRAKTREELRYECEKLWNKSTPQALVLDAMLKVKKGILLTELLEQTKGSRSPVDTLAKKGLLILDIVRIDRSPLVNEEYFQTKPKPLNSEQQKAFDTIVQSIDNHCFETHLLYGITGSGKTEIYLQAIDKTLAQEKGVIMLVPEISLTAQMIERFRSRFEGNIAILHHRLSQGERYDEWHRIRRGKAKIAIGARSAIYSPIQNLGLIIVDEEHEKSYKQTDEMPCYHARDVAVMRGKFSNSTVILGSATPSFESYTNAQQGKYRLSTLQSRADAAKIPNVTIIDMREEDNKAKRFTSFSDELLNGISKRQQTGEQVILFLNRRGYHTTLLCQQCQHILKCPHCDLSLTLHKNDQSLRCHLCGYDLTPPPRACPKCKSHDTMKYKGIGTEQVEKALHAILPDIRTIRMDADTTRHKGSHQKLLRNFGAGKADVLIGTQMIAKGLHFPEVTLVGVLNCDIGLHIPDFRASETLFQLITQVAGRSGRGVTAGEVIVQTRVPDNSTIQLAVKQDFCAFYDEEITIRKMFRYPPFVRMAKITFTGPNAHQTMNIAKDLRQQLTHLLPPTFELHPITPCGYAKVKDNYRYQFLIKGNDLYTVTHHLEALLLQHPKVRISVDIDPTNTFF